MPCRWSWECSVQSITSHSTNSVCADAPPPAPLTPRRDVPPPLDVPQPPSDEAPVGNAMLPPRGPLPPLADAPPPTTSPPIAAELPRDAIAVTDYLGHPLDQDVLVKERDPMWDFEETIETPTDEELSTETSLHTTTSDSVGPPTHQSDGVPVDEVMTPPEESGNLPPASELWTTLQWLLKDDDELFTVDFST